MVEPPEEILNWMDSEAGVRLMDDATRFTDEHFRSVKRGETIDVVEKWRRCFNMFPEFRSLTDYRLQHKNLYPRLPRCEALYFMCNDIGGGCFIQHGHSTRLFAHRIGRNFHVNQNVTIGAGRKSGRPTIGDNVSIRTGAVVVGPIKIGDGAHIGANAVVNFDVPPGAHVVAPRAQIIMPKAGSKTDAWPDTEFSEDPEPDPEA